MVVESVDEEAISQLGVPIIDVSPLIKAKTTGLEQNNNSDPDFDRVVKEIADAVRNWGFYYAVGHGIQEELIQALKDQSRAFIDKPKEFKRKIGRTQENSCGYFENEYTKLKLDWKEGFDVQSTDGVIGKAAQWPEGMPEFRETVTKYFYAVADLAHELTRALALSLSGDLDYIDRAFRNAHTSLFRINYYGKCPEPDAFLGVGPHTDIGTVTVLLQDEGINSLQLERNGKWYNVPPVPGSFVINTGDMFQVWSNDLYHAAQHRVLANKEKDRFSFPLFYHPSYDTVFEPLGSSVTAENPAHYKPINFGFFRTKKFYGDLKKAGEEDHQITDYLIK